MADLCCIHYERASPGLLTLLVEHLAEIINDALQNTVSGGRLDGAVYMLKQVAGRITDELASVEPFPQKCKVQVVWVHITALRAFATIVQEGLVLAPVMPPSSNSLSWMCTLTAWYSFDRWVMHWVRERN